MVKPTNEGYLGNQLIKRAGVDIEYTENELNDYIKCQEDPAYFIEQYTQIIYTFMHIYKQIYIYAYI